MRADLARRPALPLRWTLVRELALTEQFLLITRRPNGRVDRSRRPLQLTALGQTFYEGPGDIHVVGRNASQTKLAKFVVFLVKDKGAPVLVPTN